MRQLDHRFEYVDPATLGVNPRNWKTHPADQLAAMGGLIDEVGFLIPILFNDTTGRILDGHGRKELALKRGWPVVPVLRVCLDESQEPKALASIDSLGLTAEVDGAAFVKLLRDVETSSPELMDLLSGAAKGFGFGADEDQRQADEPSPSEAGDAENAGPAQEDDAPPPDPRAVLDIVYPSDNEWGIPRLDPRYSAPGVVFPAVVWGSCTRKRHAGTLVFYTTDDRFRALWDDPAVILDSTPVAIVEPNYSTHSQMPLACVLFHTYQKRWIARFLASKGVTVFVDLNVCAEHQWINLLGVPREWRAFATRSHCGGASIEAEWQVARDHTGTDDFVFLVYGGGADVRALCESRGWHWLPEHSDVVRGRAAAPLSSPPLPPIETEESP